MIDDHEAHRLPWVLSAQGALLLLVACAIPAGLIQAQTIVAGLSPASFQVTETGAAVYRIPIQAPPPIAGIGPQLAISYNSRAGNGMLGVGWNLEGLSVIHRCGRSIVQDTVNVGVSYDANDRYCLDGQRLVAVSGTYGANNTEYRTERESYTKVVSYGTAGTGPASFKAWTKSGQILEYGSTADSKIEAQGKTSVRVWALNKLSDTKGNYLTVSYTEDMPNGEYIPARIDFTGNSGTAAQPYASVRFTYATRTDNQPVYVGGSVIKLMKRLTNVKTYNGETLISDYSLTYTYGPSSGPSLVTSIKQCAADGSCLNATTVAWQTSTGSTGVAAASGWGSISTVGNAALGDLNGDGYADIVWTEGLNLYARFSTGTAFGSTVNLGAADYSSQSVYNVDTGWYTVYTVSPIALGDVNGDGKADIVTVKGAGAGNVRLSTGTGVQSAVNWGSMGTTGNGAVGDLNGDGKADVVWTQGLNLYARFSTGSAFGSTVNLGAADYSTQTTCDVDNNCSTTYPLSPIGVGDVNGDGRADVVTLQGTGNGKVRLSTGTGLAAASNWGSISANAIFGETAAVADLNGDGYADVVWTVVVSSTAYSNSSAIYARYSNGAGFGGIANLGGADTTGYPPVGPDNYDWTYKPSPIAAGDVSGEGKADVVTVKDTGNGNVRKGQVPTPNLVASITNSLAQVTTISYKTLTDATVYAKDTDAVWPVRDLLPQGPVYVVSSVSTPDLTGGNYVSQYFYRGAKAHLKGGGFLGFRQFQVTEQGTGNKSLASFRQVYPFKGLPTVSERQQSSGTVISRTTNTWADNPAVNALGYSFSTGNYHRSDLAQSVEQSYELNGSLVVTATATNTYDAHGNALSILVGTGDGYSKTTTSTFTNDTTNWFLGRLTRSTVQSTTP